MFANGQYISGVYFAHTPSEYLILNPPDADVIRTAYTELCPRTSTDALYTFLPATIS